MVAVKREYNTKTIESDNSNNNTYHKNKRAKNMNN